MTMMQRNVNVIAKSTRTGAILFVHAERQGEGL